MNDEKIHICFLRETVCVCVCVDDVNSNCTFMMSEWQNMDVPQGLSSLLTYKTFHVAQDLNCPRSMHRSLLAYTLPLLPYICNLVNQWIGLLVSSHSLKFWYYFAYLKCSTLKLPLVLWDHFKTGADWSLSGVCLLLFCYSGRRTAMIWHYESPSLLRITIWILTLWHTSQSSNVLIISSYR